MSLNDAVVNLDDALSSLSHVEAEATDAAEAVRLAQRQVQDFVCPECPPQFPQTGSAPLAAVRDLFDHGGDWASRPAWEAAMGRPPRRRSLWAVAGSEAQQETWLHNLVNDILNDDGATTYIVGLNPTPGGLAPDERPAHYARLATELKRLGARAARVWIRFGWEPDGDWYNFSWRLKGQPFSEARYAGYVRAWRSWKLATSTTGVRSVLNLTAEVTKDLALRAVGDCRPDAYTMDIYAAYAMRDPVRWQRRLTEQVEVANTFDLPWAVDETSPYVDKVASTGVQVGALDSKLSIQILNVLVAFVQERAGAGQAPLWVQLFERNKTEGKFAIVSVQAPASTGAFYRAADGSYRYSTAPRTAAALVTLLGNPR